jgi:hypothetical protein
LGSADAVGELPAKRAAQTKAETVQISAHLTPGPFRHCVDECLGRLNALVVRHPAGLPSASAANASAATSVTQI